MAVAEVLVAAGVDLADSVVEVREAAAPAEVGSHE
jgi:hypothetical protein